MVFPAHLLEMKPIGLPTWIRGLRAWVCFLGSLTLLSMMAFGAGQMPTVKGYDIIVIAGQSNGVGRGLGKVSHADPTLRAEAGRVFQLGRFGGDNLNIIPATEPLQHWGQTPGKNGDRKGFAYPFALRYAQTLVEDRAVLLVPVSRGSTSILQWDKMKQSFIHAKIDDTGPAATELYDDMLLRVRTAIQAGPDNHVVAVCWQQGEADVNGMTNPHSDIHDFMTGGALYQQKLEELRAQLRHDLGDLQSKPFLLLVGAFTPDWQPGNGSAAGLRSKHEITLAMKRAVKSDPLGMSRFVDSTTIAHGSNSVKDAIHYSADGAYRLGKCYFEVFEGN